MNRQDHWFAAKLLLTVSIIFMWSCDTQTGCEDARTAIVAEMKSVCGGDGYQGGASAFCSTCVAKGYYATTGPSQCECKRLTFDQDFCSYSQNSEAEPAVRDAIDFADNSCPTFTLPGEDAGVSNMPPGADAGGDAAPSNDSSVE